MITVTMITVTNMTDMKTRMAITMSTTMMKKAITMSTTMMKKAITMSTTMMGKRLLQTMFWSSLTPTMIATCPGKNL